MKVHLNCCQGILYIGVIVLMYWVEVKKDDRDQTDPHKYKRVADYVIYAVIIILLSSSFWNCWILQNFCCTPINWVCMKACGGGSSSDGKGNKGKKNGRGKIDLVDMVIFNRVWKD